MKLLTTSIILAFVLMGCKKENPESLFSTDKETYKVKESIQFSNQSEHGVSYLWDFGDGESSELKNPGHTYTEAGEYIVTLRVEGGKKTVAAEYNKKITIVDSSNGLITPDIIFANSTWISDSLTHLYYNCNGTNLDYSSNTVNHSMTFYDDNTVLMLNSNIANICDYTILNDTLIGFIESGYFRTWTYSIDGNRLTLKQQHLNPCNQSPGLNQGEVTIKHFYKQ